jgi:xanthine dehydrogenase YagT iron-sulfur-binding subunit
MDHDTHDEDPHPRGVSRRGFITSVGTGAIGVAAAATLAPAAPAEAQVAEVVPAGEVATVTLTVNGRRHKMLVEPRWSLLYVLRDRLGLTGTKVGCERGECGEDQDDQKPQRTQRVVAGDNA